MKLLKLTYIAHGYYLGFFGKPLFSNQVQAWKYGPVIPDLYHVVKRFGSNNVDNEIVGLYAEQTMKTDDEEFLTIIWNNFKQYDGLQLSSKTHEKDTPWDQTFDGAHHKIIENTLIKEYYKNLIESKQNA